MLARKILPLIALTSVAVFCGVTASEAGYIAPQPKAGAYKFNDAKGGFTLKHGHGKKKHTLYLGKVRSATQNNVGCPDTSLPIKVSGKFPLKYLKLAGYPGYKAWGVGKTGVEKRYSDGSPGIVSVPAKVFVGGKKQPGGGIKMDFSTSDPKSFEMLIIEFGPKSEAPCFTYSLDASHH